ncbi:MAG: S1 RNA-binding domain-containing protein, partial [Phycisphaerae bacterium]
MSDNLPQPDGPDDPSLNEAAPGDQPGGDATPPPGHQTVASTLENIELEVAEAMASMNPADLAELCGEVPVHVAEDPGSNGETVSRGTELDGEAVAPGTELTGTVAGVSEDEVFLEFGVKSQGIVPRSHFGKKEAVDIGRRVDVVVERFDAEAGLLVVYRQGAIQRATWTNLAVGGIVEGKVTGVIKGGLEVDLKGIRAFMPASQVDTAVMKDISLLLNESVRCEVIELDRRNKNVVLSRRKVLVRQQAEAREKLKAELEVGQTRRGVVGNITSFGAFIDLGGIDGLVHIGDLSWGTVDKVADVLSPGQEVEVKVLKIDSKRDRISLGIKQAKPDPWGNVPERYPVGTTLKVRVVRIADFGVFAELEPGVEGLIPLSEMG